MSDSRHNIEVNALIDALRARHEPLNEGFVPKNTLNILVMGIVAAAGALVWTTVTNAPENLGLLQQQTAEIRTTVLEMRGTLTGINERLENNTRQTSEQQAKITGLEAQVVTNTGRIQQIEEDLRAR